MVIWRRCSFVARKGSRRAVHRVERRERQVCIRDRYRPDRDGGRDEALPVYVWIHGGSNNFGASRDYDGTSLANLADAVVVVVQYRLGPLGWFHKAAVQTDGLYISPSPRERPSSRMPSSA